VALVALRNRLCPQDKLDALLEASAYRGVLLVVDAHAERFSEHEGNDPLAVHSRAVIVAEIALLILAVRVNN